MSVPSSKRERVGGLATEEEIDLGRVWRSTIARWWLPLGGGVAGAIVGLLLPLGGGKQWKATSEIYLGQPLSSAADVSSAPTSLGLATAYINSLYALRQASKASGIPVSRLSGAISVKPILGLTGTKIGQPAPLMLLSVAGSKPDRTQKAAQDLSNLVVAQFQPYTRQKIKIVQARLTQERSQVAAINRRLRQAQDAQAALARSAANQALVANYAQTITTLSNQRFASQSDIALSKTVIAQARGIEQPRIVSPALAANQGGPSRRSGVLIGAAIGFLLGLIAATLWDPLAQTIRLNKTAA
jgi:hypothetical protein